MKKILSMVCALFLGMAVQAQIVTSTSQSITRQKTESTTMHYSRVGLNIMNFSGSEAEGLSGKVGYDISWGFHKALGSQGGYWGMEAGLSSRGYSMEYEYEEEDYLYGYGYYDYTIKCKNSLIAHNIYYVPFQFGWKFNVGNGISIDPHVAAFLSFDYTGKEKQTMTDEDGDKFSESVSLGDTDWRRADAGLKLGVGVWYKKFNLDLSYQRGFVAALEDCDFFSNNFQIRLGYAF